MKRYIETIKIIDGSPQNLAAHYARMERTIGKCHPLELHTTLSGVVKCRVLYDSEHLHEITYSQYRLPTIETLQLVVSDEICYDLKDEDRSAINTLFNSRSYDVDDVLIVRNGLITDTSFCNVVFENSSGLFTPSKPLLRGTQRQKLLDERVIKEREIRVEDIDHYDRVLLINVMIELTDSVAINCNSVHGQNML